MCMILDTNQFHKLFKGNDHIKPIHEWLKNDRGKLVYTLYGKFGEEIKRMPKVRQYLHSRKKAEKAKLFQEDQVREGEEEIKQKAKRKNYRLKSDDLHILGLAQTSNTKLLCSDDGKLCEDFEELIAQNSIYKNQTHKHLLTRDACP